MAWIFFIVVIRGDVSWCAIVCSVASVVAEECHNVAPGPTTIVVLWMVGENSSSVVIEI